MPNFDPATLDYVLLAPQFIVTGLIFVCLSLDLMVYGRGHRFIGWVAIMGLAVGIGAQASLWGVRSSFAGVLRVDDYSNLFNIIFMAAGIGLHTTWRVLRIPRGRSSGHGPYGAGAGTADRVHRIGTPQLFKLRLGVLRQDQLKEQ
ncbi:MAG: hypothetical protein EBT47_10010 [Chloroflexi bacterium]|nr:hypothetical protein [Chloroflexota bacterium]